MYYLWIHLILNNPSERSTEFLCVHISVQPHQKVCYPTYLVRTNFHLKTYFWGKFLNYVCVSKLKNYFFSFPGGNFVFMLDN